MKFFKFTHCYELPIIPFEGPPRDWPSSYIERLAESERLDFTVSSGRAGVLDLAFCREAETAAEAYVSAITEVLTLLPEAVPIWSTESWWPRLVTLDV